MRKIEAKVRFPEPGNHDRNGEGLSRRHIMTAVEASLRRLRTDYIDVYTMAGLDPLTPLKETLRALDDLVTAGKVRYLGLTNFPAWMIMKSLAVSDTAGSARVIAAQYQYSLVMRDIEDEFVPLCLSEGVGLTCWGPLGGGFLTGKYTRDHHLASTAPGRIADTADSAEEAWDRRNTDTNWRTMEQVVTVADARGASPSQVAIAWLRAQPGVASVILGTRLMRQLEDNLAAGDLDLSSEELQALSVASAPPQRYPYRFISISAQRSPNPAPASQEPVL